MRLESAFIIAKREYLARLKTKGFWIMTVALPLLVAAMGVLPSLLMLKTDEAHRLAVVDATGVLGEQLVARVEREEEPGLERVAPFAIELVVAEADAETQTEQLDRRVLDNEIDAWIRIDDAAVESGTVAYRSESVSNFLTQERLERNLSAVVRSYRLERAGYDVAEVGHLARSLDLTTVRVSEEGSSEEGAATGIILAYVLFFMLYMVLVIYGTQVMNGVLEEKTSRIVEVIISTARPIELMVGKLSGICLTALTQLAIWMGTLAVVTMPGVVATMAWIPSGVKIPTIGPLLLVHFFLLFLLGFFMFSTFYAMIGAAFNNVQEAQQFASVAVIFLVAPIFLFWKILNDPDGTVAIVASLIPLFTPLLMMLRIAVKMPPLWQILLGYALTTAFTFLMIWIAARVYRIGILMYGKKPTLVELWRWIRYA